MLAWGFRPQTNVVETLEWLTFVQRCKSVERRQALRWMPRQEFAHQYILDPNAYSKAVETARAIGVDACYVPAWTEYRQIGSIGTHTVALYVDTGLACYSAGGYVLIWDSNLHFEVVQIDAVHPTYLSLHAATVDGYTEPCVMPCRIGHFTKDFAADRESANSYVKASASLMSTVTEDLAFQYTSNLTYPFYLGTDTGGLNTVITDPVALINGMRDEHTRPMETLDSSTGPVARYALQSSPTQESVLAWHCYDRAELWNRRIWLHSMRGQLTQAWTSTWNEDITLVADIVAGSTYMQIEAVGWNSVYPNPTDIAIVFKVPPVGADKFLCFRVGAATSGSGTELLPLTGTPFAVNIPMSNVDKICRLTLSRFAADRIEIQHLPGGQADIVVPIKEVPVYP